MSTIEQRTFDAAYKGLASQGWRQSVNSNGGCLYRHPLYTQQSGTIMLKCAAGHMTPDDAYDLSMEQTRANTGLVRKVIEQAGYDVDFAAKIQKCHDGESVDEEAGESISFTAMNPTELQAAFDAFAGKHGLTIPTIPERVPA